MHELVDEHLDAVRVVAEHRRGRLETRDVAVMVGAEHVDRAVEAALELVLDIRDVGREVEVRAVRRIVRAARSLSSPCALVRAQSVPSAS